MKEQANNHQTNLEELVPALEPEGLSSENIQTEPKQNIRLLK